MLFCQNVVNGVDNNLINQSSIYIKQVEKLNDAWALAIQLANENDPNFAYYGCFMLNNKIRNNFDEVSDNDQQNLKASLYVLCHRFANGIN